MFPTDEDSPLPPATICGEPLVYAPPRCTRPVGHAGTHKSTQIPEPLAAAVASALRADDELHREVESVRALRHEHKRRAFITMGILIGAIIGNAALFIVQLFPIVGA